MASYQTAKLFRVLILGNACFMGKPTSHNERTW